MPDKRKHRSRHPDDVHLFAPGWHGPVRTAVAEYSWLLTRGYATPSALKLVGDRHTLHARQRLAVMRSACSDQALEHRRRTNIPWRRLGEIETRISVRTDIPAPLGIDGYNVLVTIERALAGGLILIGRDGCARDLASMHGTYRKVAETRPAFQLILEFVAEAGFRHVDLYLDRPVSNSGRLKALMADILEAADIVTGGQAGAEKAGASAVGRTKRVSPSARGASPRERGHSTPQGGERTGELPAVPHDQPANPTQPTWNIELLDSPDKRLVAYDGVVATADSAILDARRTGPWANLAATLIAARLPDAWKVDFT